MPTYFDPDPAPEQPPEKELPIEMMAKELGPPYWLKQPASATNQAYDGPGWLLAGVIAGNKLELSTPITKSKLLRLGEEAASHAIGYSAHPKKKEG